MEGRTLSHYRIADKIGEGGMGVVYRARDLHLERDVALKVLPPGLLAEDEARRRFRKEAMALSRLNHPNVATVYDFDSLEGMDFLVMELIPGVTLTERLGGGPLAEAEVVSLALQLAEGLTCAHDQGVIHRDLKPGNVRITPDGRLKVLDFGLARQTGTRSGLGPTTTLTDARTTVGTLAYMAPEVLGGARADPRADVFALGVVLYEMATGRHPYVAETGIALMYAMLQEAPPSPRSLNPALSVGLEAVILRAMERDPEHRYPSARQLLADLVHVRDHPAAPRTARRPTRAAKGRVRSLAVLPLENLSGDPSQDFFADGMTEALISDLARIEGLRVISRTSAMRYKGARKPLPEIAAELNVDAIVEGSVLRAGDRVRITTQLVHAATDAHLWVEAYERDLRDVLALQSEVARSIAREIQLKLSRQTRARLSERRRVDPEAYDAYLKGRYAWNRRTEGSLRRSAEFFQRAIEKDPGYARAYAGLADAYNILGFYSYLPATEAFPRAKAAALKALEMDETLGEAHAALGYVLHYHDWRWTEAERELRRAIQLNPSYAVSHQYLGNHFSCLGRLDEAMVEALKARELDPLSMILNTLVGWFFIFLRDYDRAITELHKTRELDPSFMLGRLICGWAHAQKGEFPEALAEFEQAAVHGGDAAVVLAYTGHALAISGDGAAARQILERLLQRSATEHVSAFLIALLHCGLGEGPRALDWLEKAYDERSHWLTFLGGDPRLDPLRGLPKFEELRRRVGV